MWSRLLGQLKKDSRTSVDNALKVGGLDMALCPLLLAEIVFCVFCFLRNYF